MPPPPPPPVVDEEEVGSDSEALYSMLIAWYMSGYHTGYYQVGMQRKTVIYYLNYGVINIKIPKQ